MNLPLSRRLRRAALALPTAAVLLFGATATTANAASATVTGGSLTWSIVNDYSGSGAVGRTSLGFFTRANNAQGQLRGTVSATGSAWGDVVTPLSTRGPGVTNSWTYPVIGGTYDAVAKTGTVKLLGTVKWAGQHPTTDAPFKVTVQDPTIVFDGSNTAKLYASGSGADGFAVENTYTDDAPLFTLDLTGVTPALDSEGALAFGALIPTYVKTSVFFGLTSTGPDRTPNTYGSFSLKLLTPQSGPKGETGAKGDTGPAGAKGDKGDPGAVGAEGATRVIAHLRTAPWAGTKTRKVSLLKKRTTVATGTLQKKTLTVTVKKGKKVPAGTYTLKRSGSSAKKTVRIG